jgi:DNA topoisomerase-1
MRDADKFDHLSEFARVLPRIRRQVSADMALQGLPRRKVLALIVRLLERTCIRIGNERYAEENDSFGLTTMRNRHVKVSGARIEFQFRGKSGKFHRIAIDDPGLARVIRRIRDLPGQELFQYMDDAGEVQSIGSSDVNEYLKEISGYDEISTKDFRTWNGSVYVASWLRGRVRREQHVGITHVAAAVRAASQQLGNTPAICRKSYVHPRVLDPGTWREAHRRTRRAPRGLRVEEAAFLDIIRPLTPERRTRGPRRPRSPSSQAASRPSP